MSRPRIDHADKFWAAIDARPEPTQAMWDRWRQIIADRDPSLLDMLLGERAGGAT